MEDGAVGRPQGTAWSLEAWLLVGHEDEQQGQSLSTVIVQRNSLHPECATGKRKRNPVAPEENLSSLIRENQNKGTVW